MLINNIRKIPPVPLGIQSMLLREERHGCQKCNGNADKFQSTLLREERPLSLRLQKAVFVFQSTLLREERLNLLCAANCCILFQSTLLREERQQKCTIFLMHICNNYCIVSKKSHQHCNNYFINTKNIAFFRCESSVFSCSLMIRTALKYQCIFY